MSIITAIILLGVLIFVHELGHFIFAKLMGVKVLKFSIGFGPRLISKQVGETEYKISAIPLGGYVKMFGEESGEELHLTGDKGGEPGEEDMSRAFSSQPVWKRFAIVLAGPVFNVVFAVLVFTAIYVSGVPDFKPILGAIDADTPAGRAGLALGDRVVEINGRKIDYWSDIAEARRNVADEPMRIVVDREGRTVEFTLVPEKETFDDVLGDEREIWATGMVPFLPPRIGKVLEGTPAEKSGVREGDIIVEIDGVRIRTWEEMTKLIHESPGTPLDIKFERDGEVFERTITPEKKSVQVSLGEKRDIGLIGISPKTDYIYKGYPVVTAARYAVNETFFYSKLIFRFIGKLFQEADNMKEVGGPIRIVGLAHDAASEGFLRLLRFMAAISINLGIINLFPIPILDGGHLLFLSLEGIRRKPLSERAVMTAQRIGLALLLMLILVVTYNDIMFYLRPYLNN